MVSTPKAMGILHCDHGNETTFRFVNRRANWTEKTCLFKIKCVKSNVSPPLFDYILKTFFTTCFVSIYKNPFNVSLCKINSFKVRFLKVSLFKVSICLVHQFKDFIYFIIPSAYDLT